MQSIAKVNMKEEIDGLNKIKTQLINLDVNAEKTLKFIRLQDKKYTRTARLGRFLLRTTGFGTDRAKFKKILEQKNYLASINDSRDQFNERIRQIDSLIKNADTPSISADAYKGLLVRRLHELEKEYTVLKEDFLDTIKDFYTKCGHEETCRRLLRNESSERKGGETRKKRRTK